MTTKEYQQIVKIWKRTGIPSNGVRVKGNAKDRRKALRQLGLRTGLEFKGTNDSGTESYLISDFTSYIYNVGLKFWTRLAQDDVDWSIFKSEHIARQIEIDQAAAIMSHPDEVQSNKHLYIKHCSAYSKSPIVKFASGLSQRPNTKFDTFTKNILDEVCKSQGLTPFVIADLQKTSISLQMFSTPSGNPNKDFKVKYESDGRKTEYITHARAAFVTRDFGPRSGTQSP